MGRTAPVFPARQMLPYCSVRASAIASACLLSLIFAPIAMSEVRPRGLPAVHPASPLRSGVPRRTVVRRWSVGDGAAPLATGNLYAHLCRPLGAEGAGIAWGLEALGLVDRPHATAEQHAAHRWATSRCLVNPPRRYPGPVRRRAYRRGPPHVSETCDRATSPGRPGAHTTFTPEGP